MVLLASSPIPSIYSKQRISYPSLTILPLLCMNSHLQDNENCHTISGLSSPTSSPCSTATTSLKHFGHLKLSPVLLIFLSPEHLLWQHLSQHLHYIEYAPTPLLQTPRGYLPLCGLTAGSLPIFINLVLFMFTFNPLVSIFSTHQIF